MKVWAIVEFPENAKLGELPRVAIQGQKASNCERMSADGIEFNRFQIVCEILNNECPLMPRYFCQQVEYNPNGYNKK